MSSRQARGLPVQFLHILALHPVDLGLSEMEKTFNMKIANYEYLYKPVGSDQGGIYHEKCNAASFTPCAIL